MLRFGKRFVEQAPPGNRDSDPVPADTTDDRRGNAGGRGKRLELSCLIRGNGYDDER